MSMHILTNFNKSVHLEFVKIVVAQKQATELDNKYIGSCRFVIYDALGKRVADVGQKWEVYELPFSYTGQVKDIAPGLYF